MPNAVIAAINEANVQQPTQPRPPLFMFRKFRSSDGITVENYFKRFDWALELSRIPEDQHANYARFDMGAELNNALKFLVAPHTPETRTYICRLFDISTVQKTNSLRVLESDT